MLLIAAYLLIGLAVALGFSRVAYEMGGRE